MTNRLVTCSALTGTGVTGTRSEPLSYLSRVSLRCVGAIGHRGRSRLEVWEHPGIMAVGYDALPSLRMNVRRLSRYL